MKKNLPTPLADEFIKSLDKISPAETDPYFFTRLKARMARDADDAWRFPFKPVWLVSLLAIFLFINTFFLVTVTKQNKETTTEQSTIQSFASDYGLSVSTPF